MIENATALEVAWTIISLLGGWASCRLWRRTVRQARAARAWVDEGGLSDDDQAMAQAAVVLTHERRDRNFGMLLVQMIFLGLGVASLWAPNPPATETYRSVAQLALIAAQVILVATGWRAVALSDRAARLLEPGQERRREPETP